MRSRQDTVSLSDVGLLPAGRTSTKKTRSCFLAIARAAHHRPATLSGGHAPGEHALGGGRRGVGGGEASAAFRVGGQPGRNHRGIRRGDPPAPHRAQGVPSEHRESEFYCTVLYIHIHRRARGAVGRHCTAAHAGQPTPQPATPVDSPASAVRPPPPHPAPPPLLPPTRSYATAAAGHSGRLEVWARSVRRRDAEGAAPRVGGPGEQLLPRRLVHRRVRVGATADAH